MLLAVNINFAAFSVYWHHLDGQIFSIFILAVAAAEAAIALAITLCCFRNKGDVEVQGINSLKG
jgi:NADH-quinone oxidoreductase subunit K